MNKEIIISMLNEFENFVHYTEENIEFWLARELQYLLGYTDWRNFLKVIVKAKTACEVSNEAVSDHFVGVNKTIDLPKGAKKDIPDIMLTRYACYLVAQNGDPRKEEIAFAQSYFAVKTRQAEIIEQKLLQTERVQARHKLAETEKELSRVIFEQTGNDKDFGLIRSKGDKALFNHTTQQMKDKWGIKKTKPLADFLPTILLKAKDFATEITIYNSKINKMNTEDQISKEHITNNKTVRNTLISRGIKPEEVPPEDDIKKVERKLKTDEKKEIKLIKTEKKKDS